MEIYRYLYDYRQDIVNKKHNKEYWKDWNTWNILYRTLAYEISSSKDVERYGYVKQDVFEYFDDLISYVGENPTADIMNGWWYCFTVLFNVKSKRENKKTKEFIENLMKEIKNITNQEELVKKISKINGVCEQGNKVFLEFIGLVYTIGNIAPVSKGQNLHADKFDSWEYKLFESNYLKYKKDDYIEYLHFNDYSDNNKWWEDLKNAKNENENIVSIVIKYMESRILLIKKRGRSITEESY